MGRPNTPQFEIPLFWKFATIIVAIGLAKFIARGIIPSDAHYLLRLFGGALIAGAIGAILLLGVVMPFARRRAKNQKG